MENLTHPLLIESTDSMIRMYVSLKAMLLYKRTKYKACLTCMSCDWIYKFADLLQPTDTQDDSNMYIRY